MLPQQRFDNVVFSFEGALISTVIVRSYYLFCWTCGFEGDLARVRVCTLRSRVQYRSPQNHLSRRLQIIQTNDATTVTTEVYRRGKSE